MNKVKLVEQRLKALHRHAEAASKSKRLTVALQAKGRAAAFKTALRHLEVIK